MSKQVSSDNNQAPAPQATFLTSAERYMVPVLLALIVLVSAYRFLPWASWLGTPPPTAAQQATDEPDAQGTDPAANLSIDTETTGLLDTPSEGVVDQQRSKALTEKINPISDADTPVLLGDSIGNASPETEIEQAIERWRSTWQAKDVHNYFDTYRPGYEDSTLQLAHNDWLEHRYQAIVRAKEMEIAVSDLQIELHSHDSATARFLLDYRAKDASNRSMKTLEFQRMGKWWKIIKETSG